MQFEPHWTFVVAQVLSRRVKRIYPTTDIQIWVLDVSALQVRWLADIDSQSICALPHEFRTHSGGVP